MADLRVVVVGAAGRMGRIIVRLLDATPGVALAGALGRTGSPALGHDAGALAGCSACGVPVTDDALSAIVEADAIIDFSTPSTSVALADLAAQARIVHVIGTTGLTPDDRARIKVAARHAAVVCSGNMSLGVNLLAALVRRAARATGADYDIEIVEMHHRMKVDAPSGTALLLGEAAAAGRDVALDQASVRGRDGITGARERGRIGFASLRGGTVVGDHSVIFAGEGERIELAHRSEDRAIFGHGAIRAALWAHGRKPGLYAMTDVLGFSD